MKSKLLAMAIAAAAFQGMGGAGFATNASSFATHLNPKLNAYKIDLGKTRSPNKSAHMNTQARIKRKAKKLRNQKRHRAACRS